MPSNITGKLYLGDILLSTGAGIEDCGACVVIGRDNSAIAFDPSNIDYNIKVENNFNSFDPSNIDYTIQVQDNLNSFDPNNIFFNIGISVFSGIVIDPS